MVLKRLDGRARRRRQRPRGDPRRRGEQRRQRQGRVHRARAFAVRRPRFAPRTQLGGDHARHDRLRRGPRHRHDPRRPDRAIRADRGVPRPHRSPRVLRYRLGQVELRTPLVRVGRGGPDQDGAHARARRDPAHGALHRAEPGDRLRVEPVLRHDQTEPWSRNGTPRRAGVSSFGVGGTNAHLVVEEARTRPARTECRPQQLVLSARSEAALDSATTQLAHHLRVIRSSTCRCRLHAARRTTGLSPSPLPDVRTATTTRAWSPHSATRSGWPTAGGDDAAGRVHVSGQGSQYPGMAPDFTNTSRSFDERSTAARACSSPSSEPTCAACSFRPRTGAGRGASAQGYALGAARSVYGGVRAGRVVALVGRSAGRDDRPQRRRVRGRGRGRRDDARRRARLIAARGRLISGLPRGSMLAVMAPAETLERFVDGEVSLAAVNAPGFAVLSGPERRDRAGGGGAGEGVGRGAPSAHVARVPLLDDGSDPSDLETWLRTSPLRAHDPVCRYDDRRLGRRNRDEAGLLERAAALDGSLRRRRAHDRGSGWRGGTRTPCIWNSDRETRSPPLSAERRGTRQAAVLFHFSSWPGGPSAGYGGDADLTRPVVGERRDRRLGRLPPDRAARSRQPADLSVRAPELLDRPKA